MTTIWGLPDYQPWQCHGAVGEVEVVGGWDMDDAYTDNDTNENTDDDN